MEITKDIVYLGVNDHAVDLFESQYSVPNGMAYNSYLIMDDQTVVMDTVDAHFTDEWITKIAAARVLMAAGIPMVICEGHRTHAIVDAVHGEHVGTTFFDEDNTGMHAR